MLGSSETQVQPQIILDRDCLPDYLFVSYNHAVSDLTDLTKSFSKIMQTHSGIIFDPWKLHQNYLKLCHKDYVKFSQIYP